MGFNSEKQLVMELQAALRAGGEAGALQAMSRFCTPDLLWRGYHPFNQLQGPEEVARTFWAPLAQAFTALHRRQDVFMAGRNQMDGFSSVWVVSMGHLVGLFDRPWLGIGPTGRMAFLRYCEFSRVEGNRIAETAFFFDIPHLMMQCGMRPFEDQAGAHLVQPGPATHDGLMFGDRPVEEGEATLVAINAMISDLGTWQSGLPLEEELARTWHDDMIWWGPAGIGACYTIERYARQHSGPFRAAFSDRSSTGHVCRLAEGNFGGFFGWPNFRAALTGDYLGIPADGVQTEFRVIDIYRQSGGKLAENWVFIDMPHVFRQHGIELLPPA
ncbi:ester cyclase [Silicimonas sp. MF1-12-2]|uniref:ester cyclase n=1 Tax=Silicimonas sp. MF1-12-2 TaxID=3384793 RepID=UPI0039B4DBAA